MTTHPTHTQYLVLDLDETTWTVNCFGTGSFASAVWLANITERYRALLPRLSPPEVQGHILAVCDVILGHVPVGLCDNGMIAVVDKWRTEGVHVIAATARMNTLQRGTEMQKSHIKGLRFCDLRPDVSTVERRMRSLWQPHEAWPGLKHENGIWYLSMANKGLFLKALLDEDASCVFADDTHQHLVRSQSALRDTLPHHSCIHYVGAAEKMRKNYCDRRSDEAMSKLLLHLHDTDDAEFKRLLEARNPFLIEFLRQRKDDAPEMIQLHRRARAAS